jgi:hypothetical protein
MYFVLRIDKIIDAILIYLGFFEFFFEIFEFEIFKLQKEKKSGSLEPELHLEFPFIHAIFV